MFLAPPFILSIQVYMTLYMKCNRPCSVQQPHGSNYYVIILVFGHQNLYSFVLRQCARPKSKCCRLGMRYYSILVAMQYVFSDMTILMSVFTCAAFCVMSNIMVQFSHLQCIFHVMPTNKIISYICVLTLKDGHVSSKYRAILWGFATPIVWTPSKDEAQLPIVLRESRASFCLS